MCGVAGCWNRNARPGELEISAQRMARELTHRGPDDSGSWSDASLGIALGHTRLSIVDLTPLGHQPMVSPDGRYVIAYNGEIYNHQALRAKLEGCGSALRGRSDTEVLLAGIQHWGLAEAVGRTSGMFAFALVDRVLGLLHLVRDRVGEKPMYYGRCGDVLLFGSELKALKAHPAWNCGIDKNVLSLYLRHNYVPAPYSIYEGIRKVRPGTILSFRLSEASDPEERTFWSARDTVLRARDRGFSSGDRASVEGLDTLLGDVVEREMVADVPLGAFLSGGIDSSLIVSLMQARSPEPIRTFTIGFHEKAFNEAEHATAVAHHLGTHHTELYVTPDQARATIPRLPELYDEPFADSSQIPTYLVARLASQHVKVCLTGDGGDEVFGGYRRYASGERAWNIVRGWPAWSRRLVARVLTSVPPSSWDRLLRALPHRTGGGLTGQHMHRMAELTGATGPKDMYRSLVSNWTNPSAVVTGSIEPATLLSGNDPWPAGFSVVEGMMLADLLTYLADDILVKVDRASMGVSLETRAPFLDHRVIEHAWRIPLEHKVAGGEGKIILKRLLDRYVPRTLVDRPKVGFGVPVGEWIKGPLREWGEALLDERRLTEEGIFQAAAVRERWHQHLNGTRNWENHLWSVLMFEAWLGRQ